MKEQAEQRVPRSAAHSTTARVRLGRERPTTAPRSGALARMRRARQAPAPPSRSIQRAQPEVQVLPRAAAMTKLPEVGSRMALQAPGLHPMREPVRPERPTTARAEEPRGSPPEPVLPTREVVRPPVAHPKAPIPTSGQRPAGAARWGYPMSPRGLEPRAAVPVEQRARPNRATPLQESLRVRRVDPSHRLQVAGPEGPRPRRAKAGARPWSVARAAPAPAEPRSLPRRRSGWSVPRAARVARPSCSCGADAPSDKGKRRVSPPGRERCLHIESTFGSGRPPFSPSGAWVYVAKKYAIEVTNLRAASGRFRSPASPTPPRAR